MNAPKELHELGQSIWLDNITRGLVNDGTLQRYIDELEVTGLTSNPTIFQKAIKDANFYDEAIVRESRAGQSGEQLFFGLALEDLTRAADLFQPVHQKTNGVDGWVSLEVSPLLANDAKGTVAAAQELHARAARPNLFIKIPGTPAGLTAIEESIFKGVPINVTLLFSREQYLAAAQAYMRGIERRIAAGLDPRVTSVASVFISRWDVAVKDKVAPELQNRLGIAIAQRCYLAYRELLLSQQWTKLADAGALPQRLLWASTGTKDPKALDTLYLEALAAPDTINTVPEKTLLALAEHGQVKDAMTSDPAAADKWEGMLQKFAEAGIDVAALATQLQLEGAQAFDKSWKELLECIESKSVQLKKASPAQTATL